MRKLLSLIICVAICICASSCARKTDMVTLERENLSEYLSVDVTFGEVSVFNNESRINNGKYYLTCLATISVKPQGDFAFEGASVFCVLDEGGEWTPIETKKTGGIKIADLMYDWEGRVSLDKEGYGETTVYLYCYSDTYDKIHPSFEEWKCYASGAKGTVTKN